MKKFQKPIGVHVLVKKFYWLSIVIAMSFAGCKKEIAPEAATADDTELSDEEMTLQRGFPHVVVHSGASIQAAVNAAKPGTVIFIAPGIYKETILVDKPGIQLIGIGGKKHKKKAVIIDNPGEEENGIRVTDAGDGFVLKNVTIQNFEENGVILIRVDKFRLEHITSINNKEYGLFPVLCSHGVIKFCSATGSTDTGIYVGQSTNVIVEYNVAFGNVSGFEIENCTDVKVAWNESHDNVAGLSIFLLPGLTVTTSSNILVTNNYIHSNNQVNTPSGGGLEDIIPSGIGILNLGCDNVTIKQNIIRNNNFVGIATVSTLVLGALGVPVPPGGFPDIEPNPDGSRIVQNILKHNGTVAAPPGSPLPAADFLWDGSGTNNCWKNNVFSTSVPGALPVCL